MHLLHGPPAWISVVSADYCGYVGLSPSSERSGDRWHEQILDLLGSSPSGRCLRGACRSLARYRARHQFQKQAHQWFLGVP